MDYARKLAPDAQLAIDSLLAQYEVLFTEVVAVREVLSEAHRRALTESDLQFGPEYDAYLLVHRLSVEVAKGFGDLMDVSRGKKVK